MKPPIRAALLLTGVLTLAACESPPADIPARPAGTSAPAPAATSAPPAAPGSDASDVAAIRAIGASKDDAYNEGNADFVASTFEEDAVLMPPTAPITTGARRIRVYLAGEMTQAAAAGYATVFPSNSVNIGTSGNLGFRSGRYETIDGSGATVDTGKWLEVWQKADGLWRINTSIWNSDSLPLIFPGESDEDNDTGG